MIGGKFDKFLPRNLSNNAQSPRLRKRREKFQHMTLLDSMVAAADGPELNAGGRIGLHHEKLFEPISVDQIAPVDRKELGELSKLLHFVVRSSPIENRSPGAGAALSANCQLSPTAARDGSSLPSMRVVIP
jgi:hypothetical protein